MMKSILSLGLGFIFAVYFGFVALFALWTDRNMDFWMSYAKGETVDINYWWSFLLTLLGPISLLCNVISEIARAVVS